MLDNKLREDLERLKKIRAHRYYIFTYTVEKRLTASLKIIRLLQSVALSVIYIFANRGLRHYWGVRVRGQHTKTTGRRGRTVGVSKKK